MVLGAVFFSTSCACNSSCIHECINSHFFFFLICMMCTHIHVHTHSVILLACT